MSESPKPKAAPKSEPKNHPLVWKKRLGIRGRGYRAACINQQWGPSSLVTESEFKKAL